jgi:Crinkler effector protein N-terminal domain
VVVIVERRYCGSRHLDPAFPSLDVQVMSFMWAVGAYRRQCVYSNNANMSIVSLNCLVYSDEPSLYQIFDVETSRGEKISKLRSKIWERTAKHVPAKTLALYTPTTAISTVDEASFERTMTQLDLDAPEGMGLFKELKPTFTVDESGLSQPARYQLHVLVVVLSGDYSADLSVGAATDQLTQNSDASTYSCGVKTE